MSQELWHLVYTSSAINRLSENELLDLLEVSRANNVSNDITGMLLYCDRLFIQALEGPEENVHAIFAKITKDPRHSMINVLIDRKLEKRCFPDWSMGFRSYKTDELREVPGFTAILDRPGNWFKDEASKNHAMHLLYAFKKNFCF